MKTLELNRMEEFSGGISWGCALAIAGTTGATLGFIFATGGAGLAFAGGMKVLATVALIEACGSGWGEI